MEKLTYRWKEKRSVNRLMILVAIIFIGTLGVWPFIIYPIVYFFISKVNSQWMILPFFCSVPVLLVLNILALKLSSQRKFTHIFIKEIREKLSKCLSLEDLRTLKEEFMYEAFDHDPKLDKYHVRLAFPQSIKELALEITHKIDALEKVVSIPKKELEIEEIRKLAEDRFEGIHGATEFEIQLWKEGFVSGYYSKSLQQ